MRRLVQVCVLSSAVAIGGCTGGSGTPTASPPASVETSQSPATPSAPATSASPTETPSPSATVTPSASASPTAAVAASECTTAQLRLSAGRGGAAAGTFYQSLVFTNISSATCSLRGYPGASYVDSSGGQLGVPADRSEGERIRRVVLASGAKAHALLGIPETANFSKSDCQPRQAAGVRAYPPDQTASLVAKVKLTVCTTNNGRSLIQPIRPGTRG
jgi:hypothetical protein